MSPGDAEVHRLAAGPSHQGNQGVSVAARDLPAAQDLLRLVDVHDLVAAPQDGYPGPPVHQRMRHRERREHPQLRGPQLGPGGEHGGPFPDVLAGPADVDADVPVLEDQYGGRTQVCVLLPDDTVGPTGKWRAGEDPGTLARPDHLFGKAARGQLLDDAERHRASLGRAPHVLTTDGVAVHRRVGPGGDVEPAHDVLSQDAVERVVEGYPEGG